jgi:hypothetical protein
MKHKSMRTILLDFVQANGPQSWNSLHKVVLTVAGQPLTNKHWGSGYLDQVSDSSVCYPTCNEPRYLVRLEDGLYHLFGD